MKDSGEHTQNTKGEECPLPGLKGYKGSKGVLRHPGLLGSIPQK